MNTSIEKRVLHELVYERVRASVNLCQLLVIEQELERSIERASGDTAPAVAALRGVLPKAQPGDGPHSLARGFMQEAWHRLEKEWQRLRDDLDDSFD